MDLFNQEIDNQELSDAELENKTTHEVAKTLESGDISTSTELAKTGNTTRWARFCDAYKKTDERLFELFKKNGMVGILRGQADSLEFIQLLHSLGKGAVSSALTSLRTPVKFLQARVISRKQGKVATYVDGTYVKAVLNSFFPALWSFTHAKPEIVHNAVIVSGELRITWPDGNTSIHGDVGGALIRIDRDTTFPQNLPFTIKAAITDCLKRCAAQLGIAWDVYGGLYQVSSVPREHWGAGVAEIVDGFSSSRAKQRGKPAPSKAPRKQVKPAKASNTRPSSTAKKSQGVIQKQRAEAHKKYTLTENKLDKAIEQFTEFAKRLHVKPARVQSFLNSHLDSLDVDDLQKELAIYVDEALDKRGVK